MSSRTKRSKSKSRSRAPAALPAVSNAAVCFVALADGISPERALAELQRCSAELRATNEDEAAWWAKMMRGPGVRQFREVSGGGCSSVFGIGASTKDCAAVLEKFRAEDATIDRMLTKYEKDPEDETAKRFIKTTGEELNDNTVGNRVRNAAQRAGNAVGDAIIGKGERTVAGGANENGWQANGDRAYWQPLSRKYVDVFNNVIPSGQVFNCNPREDSVCRKLPTNY